MPVHDWTCVEAGIFHNFHLSWISEIGKALNGGLLPEGYYALAEQHAGRLIADVLTLHETEPTRSAPQIPCPGGTMLAEAVPKTRSRQRIDGGLLGRRRSIAVRHVSGHRLVALVEILSPGNKDRPRHVEKFATKAIDALRAGIHLLLVDLFPPGSYDPQGVHGAILELLDTDEVYQLPADEPLTLASYVADTPLDIFLEHLAPGATLPDMPLFLTPECYINTPLETTYMEAYRGGMPAFWRNVLEGQPSSSQ